MVEKCSSALGMWFRRRPWGGGRFFEGVGWDFGIQMVVMRGGEGYWRGRDTNGPPRRRRRVTEAVKAVGLPPAGGGKSAKWQSAVNKPENKAHLQTTANYGRVLTITNVDSGSR
ncbi:hypothetical protein BVRB_5g102240 [Beta vulgaris subsp. vulgaris]|nr:hypothetical protein BVRB_5g102240 [Beta vulgaris subsp. vulgaris]